MTSIVLIEDELKSYKVDVQIVDMIRCMCKWSSSFVDEKN